MPRYLTGGRTVKLGCDPEVFVGYETGRVRKRQSIVGSEVLLPPDGVGCGRFGSIVRDGVQIELHPTPAYCRANISNSIQQLFIKLSNELKQREEVLKKPLKIDLSTVVRLSKWDLSRLSEDSRRLGCNESLNVYGWKHIQRDGTKYLYRSGAGHIHMGINMVDIDPKRIVRLMDVMVGVTSVLVDRDPLNALRRKTYGRAGEYRLPNYGIEYRTLSNFWLQHYRLMSMVFGLTKIAWSMLQGELNYKERKARTGWDGLLSYPNYCYDAEQQIISKVDLREVEEAINTNDWEMANTIYRTAVRPVLADLNVGCGIGRQQVDDFDFFVNKIRQAELRGDKRPLDVWFPEDPVKHWMTKPEGHGHGWESFLTKVVAKERFAPVKITGVIEIPPPVVSVPVTTYTDTIIVEAPAVVEMEIAA